MRWRKCNLYVIIIIMYRTTVSSDHVCGVCAMHGVRCAVQVYTSFIQRQNETVIFLVKLCAIYSKRTRAFIYVAHMIDYRFTVHWDADIAYPSAAIHSLAQSHGLIYGRRIWLIYSTILVEYRYIVRCCREAEWCTLYVGWSLPACDG